MAERSRTKDELFMLRLHEEASKQPNIEDPIDRYKVGQLVGLHPKGVDTICNLLIRANFIKKQGTVEISITEQGIRLVETLKKN